MGIKAVIFDMGGVLLRTEDRQPRTELGKRLGLTYEQLESAVYDGETAVQASLGKLPLEKHWETVCQRLNWPYEQVEDLKDQFWGGDRLDIRLVDFLRALRSGLRGRVKTALLSNAWIDLRQTLAEKHPILDAFDEVFISAELGYAKPDPRIYELAVSRLGVQPNEAVFVDDVLKNVEAARKVGLQGIQFKTTDQTIAEVMNLLEKP